VGEHHGLFAQSTNPDIVSLDYVHNGTFKRGLPAQIVPDRIASFSVESESKSPW
jgi:hypothetical protein